MPKSNFFMISLSKYKFSEQLPPSAHKGRRDVKVNKIVRSSHHCNTYFTFPK